MKKSVRLVLGLIIIFFVQSCLDNKKAKNYNEKTLVDQEGLFFINNGIESGLVEVKAAAIAKVNSKNPRVLHFAEMMINDHTKAGNELKKIKNDKYVSGSDTINMEHQKALNNLSQKSGADFDRAYMQMMVADHEQAVKVFAGAVEDNSTTIKNFAKKTLPTLKMHLDSANAICAALK